VGGVAPSYSAKKKKKGRGEEKKKKRSARYVPTSDHKGKKLNTLSHANVAAFIITGWSSSMAEVEQSGGRATAVFGQYTGCGKSSGPYRRETISKVV